MLDRLARLANYDSLTGCLNRHRLRERLQQALQDCAADGQGLAVIFIDLDGFKLINDHQVGDRLLRAVAQRLRGALREGDHLARVGGDEFVVLARVVDLHEEPLGLGERLLAQLLAPFRIGSLSLRVGASLGISRYPGDSKGADQLLNDADLAMYQAKAAGGNCLAQFRPQLRSDLEARLLLDRLRRALETGQLELHYQLQFVRPEPLAALKARLSAHPQG